MKKIIIPIFCILISFNVLGNCRPNIQEDISQRLVKSQKIEHVGKVTTGATFVIVGGFYGTMGVILLGPLWTFAVIGGSFGTMAALPVGTAFLIVNQVEKKAIKNDGTLLSIIDRAEGFEEFYNKINRFRPDLSRDDVYTEIEFLNDKMALCDGTVSKANRILPTKKLIASPNDLIRWFKHKELIEF